MKHLDVLPDVVAPVDFYLDNVRFNTTVSDIGNAYDAFSNGYIKRSSEIIVSRGLTGGGATAGAGEQYVEVTIDNTRYKVLHDGTV